MDGEVGEGSSKDSLVALIEVLGNYCLTLLFIEEISIHISILLEHQRTISTIKSIGFTVNHLCDCIYASNCLAA